MSQVEPEKKMWLAEIKDYPDRCKAAFNFPGSAEGAVWNSLYLMGLAINNLELIPYSSDITPRPYWRQAPEPRGDDEAWTISWIAEVGALY